MKTQTELHPLAQKAKYTAKVYDTVTGEIIQEQSKENFTSFALDWIANQLQSGIESQPGRFSSSLLPGTTAASDAAGSYTKGQAVARYHSRSNLFDKIDLRAVPAGTVPKQTDSQLQGTQVGFVTYQTAPETPLAPLRGRILRNDSTAADKNIKISLDFGVGIADSEPITHCYIGAQGSSEATAPANNGILLDNLPANIGYQPAVDMGPAGDGVGGRIIYVYSSSLVEIDLSTLIYKIRALPVAASNSNYGTGFVERLNNTLYYFYLDSSRYIRKLNLNTMLIEATSANTEYFAFSNGINCYSPQTTPSANARDIRVYSLIDLSFTTVTASVATAAFNTNLILFFDKTLGMVIERSAGTAFRQVSLSDFLSGGLNNQTNLLTTVSALDMAPATNVSASSYTATFVHVCANGDMWAYYGRYQNQFKKFYRPNLGGSAQWSSCVAFTPPIDNTAPNTALRLDIDIQQSGTLMDLSV